MKIPQFDDATGRLIGKLRQGRQWVGTDGSMTLTFGPYPMGAGLLLKTGSDQDRLTLWLDEAQWCHWIAPVLVVPGYAMTPPDLLETLTAWTLAEARTFDNDEFQIPWPETGELTPATAERRMGWKLNVRRDERELALFLTEVPAAWLEALMEDMFPFPAESSSFLTVGAKLIAGWCSLPAQQVSALQVGDAVVLQRCWDISQGQFVLFTDRPVARLQQQSETGYFTTETLMDNFDDWMDITPPAERHSAVEHSFVTLTAEVARLEISLQELSELSPGSVLTGESQYDGLVTLKAGGRVVGRGTLLQIGERLAVRIDHLG